MDNFDEATRKELQKVLEKKYQDWNSGYYVRICVQPQQEGFESCVVVTVDDHSYVVLHGQHANRFDLIKKCQERFGFDKFDIIEIQNSASLVTYDNRYGQFVRPSLESVFMNMAIELSKRSTCLRKSVGVVFTNADLTQVLCLGYNGNYAGGPNQCDSLEPGQCGCIHAEINALTKSETSLKGATCFVSLSPCKGCAKVLINRGISRVFFHEAYRCTEGIDLLERAGIEVRHI